MDAIVAVCADHRYDALLAAYEYSKTRHPTRRLPQRSHNANQLFALRAKNVYVHEHALRDNKLLVLVDVVTLPPPVPSSLAARERPYAPPWTRTKPLSRPRESRRVCPIRSL